MTTHLDGNAVGGVLRQVFGVEMTDHRGCCDNCGTVSALATVLVYRECPGEVLRCPGCGSVVMVIVETPHGVRMGLGTLRWIEM
jgi:hypothetical protein